MDLLLGFLDSTRPATWSAEQWRQLLRAGRPADAVGVAQNDPQAERNAT